PGPPNADPREGLEKRSPGGWSAPTTRHVPANPPHAECVTRYAPNCQKSVPSSPQTPPYTRRVEQEETRRRLAWSTAIFSLATGLSRILGLVREMVAAYYFGAAGNINAFTIAFQVPNLVRSLVADAALSSAFVPVFSELLEKGERKRAWRVASTLFWLMLLGLSALTAIFILIAPWVIGAFGNPGHDRALAIGLSR